MISDSAAQPADPRPWYRQRWPWILIAIPLLGIVLSTITVTFAVMGADTDVRDGIHAPLDKTSWKSAPQAAP
ncbi:MAG: hypothetical protein HC809_12860 [Gammaproteobacteria bacterium]|nr:hypothetical protein [Gammaproteobacteria bacterium]